MQFCAKNLKKYFIIKIKQKELSRKVGFNTHTYAKYEERKNKITTLKLLSIVMFYGTSFDFIVGRSDNDLILKN